MILWFGNRAEWFELDRVNLLIDVVQTITTLFVLLEIAHRIQLGRLQFQLDWNPVGMMKEAYHSMKILVSESQMAAMRATSTQVMKSLQLVTEIVTYAILTVIVFDLTSGFESSWFNEISVRLFSVYSLQIFSKAYVAKMEK